MVLPFTIPRPNMDALRFDRLNFLSRAGGQPRAPQHAHIDEDDDESPLSPRPDRNAEVLRDVEAQQEMVERPATRFMPRIPSFFSVASSRPRQSPDSSPRMPRPSSSHYSGEGAPPTEADVESPKTPLFRIRPQILPSTRLHLPNLTRTWTRGSNGPPSRPPTAHSPHARRTSFSRARGDADGIQEPVPVVPAEHLPHLSDRAQMDGADADMADAAGRGEAGGIGTGTGTVTTGRSVASPTPSETGGWRGRRAHGGAGGSSQAEAGAPRKEGAAATAEAFACSVSLDKITADTEPDIEMLRLGHILDPAAECL